MIDQHKHKGEDGNCGYAPRKELEGALHISHYYRLCSWDMRGPWCAIP